VANVDIYNLAFGAPGFKSRVIGGCLKAAYAVLNEDPATENHVQRQAWALAVVADPMGEGTKMVYLVPTNADVQTNGELTSDNDIDYVIAVMIGSATMLAALGYS
jgi:hypothetical protein